MSYKCDICRKNLGLTEELSYVVSNGKRVHGHLSCISTYLEENKSKLLKEEEKTQEVKKTDFLLG